MAEITEIKEPTPKIAKVSEIEAKANEIKEKRALPPKPGDRVAFHELQKWLALLGPEAQERITIWVYRRDPIINRQLVDPQADNNIDILYQDFDKLSEEYMIANHGGGNYKFTIKDEDKPKTQLGGYFEATLNIPMLDNPPKLDLREVEWDNPRNKGFKSWCRSRKMIDENNKPMAEIKQQEAKVNGSGGVDASMLKMLLDFTTQMSQKEQNALKQKIGGEDAITKSMGDLMLEKMKQDDPNKSAATMIQMITAIKGIQPEPQKDNTIAVIMPLITGMMANMQAASAQAIESSKQNFQMMMEMFKANQPSPREEGDELEKLQKLLAIAKEIKGGGTAAEKTMTESLIDLGRDVLPSALTLFGNIMAMNAAAKGVQGIQPMPSVPSQPADVKQGPANFATLHERNTMNYQPQPNPPNAPALPAPSEAANLIAQFEPIIINKLAGEGWEFGAWVSEGFGDASAAGLVKYGPEGLLNAAKSVPSFWQKVESTYGEPHLRKWLASLCNYREIMNQNGKEMEEEK